MIPRGCRNAGSRVLVSPHPPFLAHRQSTHGVDIVPYIACKSKLYLVVNMLEEEEMIRGKKLNRRSWGKSRQNIEA
jgi:CRISPR/Cas system-associated exonuclease Cas4 (RecB family)